MKTAHLVTCATIALFLLATLSKAKDSSVVVGEKKQSSWLTSLSPTLLSSSFGSIGAADKLGGQSGETTEEKEDGNIENTFNTYSKPDVPSIHYEANDVNDDEIEKNARRVLGKNEFIYEIEKPTKTYERVVLEGSNIRLSCPHSNVPTPTTIRRRKNILFFQSSTKVQKNSNLLASSSVYNGEKQFVDAQQKQATLATRHSGPTFTAPSFVASLEPVVKWFRNHVPLQNLNHFQHAKHNGSSSRSDKHQHQQSNKQSGQHKHDELPLIQQTTINITELERQKAEFYQTPAASGASETLLLLSSSGPDNNNEESASWQQQQAQTLPATSAAQLNLLTKGSRFSSKPLKRMAKLAQTAPLTSENANEQHWQPVQGFKQVRKFTKMLEASSHDLASPIHAIHETQKKENKSDSDDYDDDSDYDNQLNGDSMEDGRRGYQQTQEASTNSDNEEVDDSSWHINEFGELVINKVSQYFAGKYTCLSAGLQSEVLLDVLRLTIANDNRPAPKAAVEGEEGDYVELAGSKKSKRAYFDGESDEKESATSNELTESFPSGNQQETDESSLNGTQGEAFFLANSANDQPTRTGNGAEEKKVDENKGFESKTVSISSGISNSSNISEASSDAPLVSISGAFDHSSGTQANYFARGLPLVQKTATIEPTNDELVPLLPATTDILRPEKEALAIRDTLANSIKTTSRACDVDLALGSLSVPKEGQNCRQILERSQQKDDKRLDVESDKWTKSEKKHAAAAADARLLGADTDQIRRANVSLTSGRLLIHNKNDMTTTTTKKSLPLLDLAKHPVHLVKSETIRAKDLKSIPGFLYTKQRLYCPLSMSLNDFIRAFIHPITQKLCSTTTKTKTVGAAAAAAALPPTTTTIEPPTNDEAKELKSACHHASERLIYKLIIMSQQESVENCSDSDTDHLFELNWFKDGVQLEFEKESGKVKGINLNVRMISNFSEHQFFTNSLPSSSSANEKLPVDKKERNWFNIESPASTIDGVQKTTTITTTTNTATTTTTTNARKLNAKSVLDVMSPSECPLKGRALELDGVKRDNTGRYTCALRFHLSKLDKIISKLQIRQQHQHHHHQASSPITRTKSACSNTDNDKSSCHDKQSLGSSSSVSSSASEFDQNRSTSTQKEQIEPNDLTSSESWVKKEQQQHQQQQHDEQNESEKKKDNHSLSERQKIILAKGASFIQNHYHTTLTKRVALFDSILRNQPVYEKDLNYILALLAKLHNPLATIQSFSLVVAERSANSSDLWSSVMQAASAYTRRKSEDFKRLKRSSRSSVNGQAQLSLNRNQINVYNPNKQKLPQAETNQQQFWSLFDNNNNFESNFDEPQQLLGQQRKKRAAIKRPNDDVGLNAQLDKSTETSEKSKQTKSEKLDCLSKECKSKQEQAVHSQLLIDDNRVEIDSSTRNNVDDNDQNQRRIIAGDELKRDIASAAGKQTMNLSPSNYANKHMKADQTKKTNVRQYHDDDDDDTTTLASSVRSSSNWSPLGARQKVSTHLSWGTFFGAQKNGRSRSRRRRHADGSKTKKLIKREVDAKVWSSHVARDDESVSARIEKRSAVGGWISWSPLLIDRRSSDDRRRAADDSELLGKHSSLMDRWQILAERRRETNAAVKSPAVQSLKRLAKEEEEEEEEEEYKPIRGRRRRRRSSVLDEEQQQKQMTISEEVEQTEDKLQPMNSAAGLQLEQLEASGTTANLKQQQREARRLLIDNRPRPLATYARRPLTVGLSEQQQATLSSSSSGSSSSSSMVEDLSQPLNEDADDESLMWSAGQYLYMHMRALASSSLFGVEVGVEWSNERANGSNMRRVDQAANDEDVDGDDDDDEGDDDDVDARQSTYSRYTRARTPFATLDVISGQSLHLQCTAHTLGRLAEVKWYKLIHKIPIGLKRAVVSSNLRRIGSDLYWPITELDLLDESFNDKRFACSQTTTIFDNLVNQTFTVINSLHLSQYKDLPDTSLLSSSDLNAQSNHDYNLYACIVDADVRHNYATLGVHFRQTHSMDMMLLSKRLLARQTILGAAASSASTISAQPKKDADLFETNSSSLGQHHQVAANAFKSPHFDLFRESSMQTVPLKSFWIPIKMVDKPKKVSIKNQREMIIDELTLAPTSLIMIIVVVFGSLIGLIYLTLRSYNALTQLQLDEHYNEQSCLAVDEDLHLRGPLIDDHEYDICPPSYRQQLTCSDQINQPPLLIINNNTTNNAINLEATSGQVKEHHQMLMSSNSSSSRDSTIATPTCYTHNEHKDTFALLDNHVTKRGNMMMTTTTKRLYAAHVHNIEVTHNCNCHQAALTHLIREQTDFSSPFAKFSFPNEEDDDEDDDNLEPSCCRAVGIGSSVSSSSSEYATHPTINNSAHMNNLTIRMVENPFGDMI